MSPQTPSKATTSSRMDVEVLASYSGPLPSAEELEHYEKLYNGAAKLFFDKFSEEQTHRQDVEKNESNANIKAMDRYYDIASQSKRLNFIGNLLGQVFSVIVEPVLKSV